jgi:hypothetical protein
MAHATQQKTILPAGFSISFLKAFTAALFSISRSSSEFSATALLCHPDAAGPSH